MKKWMKILIGLFIIGIIGAGLGYKFIYNKPHTNYEKASPEHMLTSNEIFDAYRNTKGMADASYTGKVIQISGSLSKVETPDSLTVAVFVLDEGLFGEEGIRCTMLENHANEIRQMPGKKITLKGYCTGFNDTDVILEYCSVVKQ